MSVQNVAESLAARGHELVAATLNPEKKYKVTEVGGVKVHYLPVRNLYFPNQAGQSALKKALWHSLDSYNPFMGAAFGAVLDAERPDVVNTHNVCGFSASVWRAVKKRRVPLVHTVRDRYLVCSRSGMFRNGKVCSKPCMSCLLYSWPRRRLSRFVDVATGISQNVLDGSCQSGCFPESEKIVIHNACEVAPQNRTARGRGNGALRFGYLGRLHPSKGVGALIRSFLELPGGQAKLLIGGRGAPEYEDDLRRVINGRSDIRMLGHVDPADFFSQVDVTVVPSLCQEAAGRVVLESMAHRVPVIGSSRGGIAEQMGEGTGWVFNPDESGALTQMLQLAINSPGELAAMSQRASGRIAQFSTESMVKGYLKAYSCAIDRNSQSSQGRRSAAS